MLKKTPLMLALLSMAACTSNYYQCPKPHGPRPHGPMAEAAPPPPEAPADEAAPPPSPKPQAPKKAGKPHAKNDAWRGEATPPPPPPQAASAPEPMASDDEYHWNANRGELAPGGHFNPPAPGAAAISGHLIDPLSFPHFCGPGARERSAC